MSVSSHCSVVEGKEGEKNQYTGNRRGRIVLCKEHIYGYYEILSSLNEIKTKMQIKTYLMGRFINLFLIYLLSIKQMTFSNICLIITSL